MVFLVVTLSHRWNPTAFFTEGPYFIGPRFLHVQRWQHDFRVDSAVIKDMVVWARFLNVSLEGSSTSDWQDDG